MKLYEYEAKEIFRKYDIPVPTSALAKDLEEAKKAATKVGFPIVVKAQVLVGGRGKAGGVKIANDEKELEEIAEKILGMKIKGERVTAVLIEKKVDIKKELYLSVTVDRSKKAPLIIASALGGVDIEEIAEKYPEKIIKRYIDTEIGFKRYIGLEIANKLNIDLNKKVFSKQLEQLWKIFEDFDAELVEINPLVLQEDGTIVAADAKMIIDDNSMFRHKDFEEKLEKRTAEYSARELAARENGMAYVELDGDIGIIGNGAGLVMATMDVVKLYGGKPANFLDVGGGASAERMKKALEIVSSHPNVKVIFINILGGITKCDDMANGIVAATRELNLSQKIVIRLIGTNEEAGKKILTDNGFHALDSMEEAAKKAVDLAKEGE
ncbi:MAG: ADP-forming succinate--CoA ligase subunit beta [Candidatus Odinarchaeota archaeon]|nr:ADP-forming succinate--CoA ligase subunit beta [Candidatus Odinarchaeota archaeon]